MRLLIVASYDQDKLDLLCRDIPFPSVFRDRTSTATATLLPLDFDALHTIVEALAERQCSNYCRATEAVLGASLPDDFCLAQLLQFLSTRTSHEEEIASNLLSRTLCASIDDLKQQNSGAPVRELLSHLMLSTLENAKLVLREKGGKAALAGGMRRPFEVVRAMICRKELARRRVVNCTDILQAWEEQDESESKDLEKAMCSILELGSSAAPTSTPLMQEFRMAKAVLELTPAEQHALLCSIPSSRIRNIVEFRAQLLPAVKALPALEDELALLSRTGHSCNQYNYYPTVKLIREYESTLGGGGAPLCVQLRKTAALGDVGEKHIRRVAKELGRTNSTYAIALATCAVGLVRHGLESTGARQAELFQRCLQLLEEASKAAESHHEHAPMVGIACFTLLADLHAQMGNQPDARSCVEQAVRLILQFNQCSPLGAVELLRTLCFLPSNDDLRSPQLQQRTLAVKQAYGWEWGDFEYIP